MYIRLMPRIWLTADEAPIHAQGYMKVLTAGMVVEIDRLSKTVVPFVSSTSRYVQVVEFAGTNMEKS